MQSRTVWGIAKAVIRSARDFTGGGASWGRAKAATRSARDSTEDAITYFLRESKDGDTVSTRFHSRGCDHVRTEGEQRRRHGQHQIPQQGMRSRTCWGRAKAATWSARGFTAGECNHVLAEGEQRQRRGQHEISRQGNAITYFLRESKGHDTVSTKFHDRGMQSCTRWGMAKAVIRSAQGFPGGECNYVQSEGWQRQRHDQRRIAQQDAITYELRDSKGHDTVSVRFHSRGMQSRTDWGIVKAATRSAWSFTAGCNHVRAEKQQRPRLR